MSTTRPVTPGLFTVRDDGPRLLVAGCGQCTRLHFPASEICPYCGETGCATREIGPHATLFLYTTVERPPPGYRGAVPYGFGVVELPEGIRIVTRLAGFEASTPRHGLPVRLVVESLGRADDDITLITYAFAPS